MGFALRRNSNFVDKAKTHSALLGPAYLMPKSFGGFVKICCPESWKAVFFLS
jgi:hypothetical protein